MNSLFLIISLTLISFYTKAINGQLISKTEVSLQELPCWSYLSTEGHISEDHEHLKNLSFYYLTYISDSNYVTGISIEPKSKGMYPAVIFNRAGMMTYLALKNSSIFILVGENDTRVNPSHSYRMAEKLKEINYDCKLVAVKSDHYFTEHKAKLNESVISWFDEKMKHKSH